MPPNKGPERKKLPVGLSEEERGWAADIVKWTDATTDSAAIRLALKEYRNFLAWNRLKEEREE